MDWSVLALGTGLFVGSIPPKVATLATVLGIPLAYGLHWSVGWTAYLPIVFVLCTVGIFICGRSAQLLGLEDPREVTYDEIVTLPIVYFLVPYWTWQTVVAGFALHRLFDILKPFGIRRLEKMGGGLGIMADDFAAAWCAWLVMQGLIRSGVIV